MVNQDSKEDNFKGRRFFEKGASIGDNDQGNLRLKVPGPTWVNLFYDLAWTATFASLTQNGSFNELWDNMSYVTFFILVWWLWVSQTWYHVHFYVDDWFHLVCIFLQLVVFGMLAATTRAFDVTVYITHSPGTDIMDPQTTDQMMDPDRYQAERIAKLSIKVVAISLACSRVILFVQYLRVIISTFRSGEPARRIRGKLCFIATGLAISIALFFSAWGVYRSSYGRDPSRAWVKFVFWGLGIAVEALSTVISWHYPDSQGLPFSRKQDSPNIRGRLEAITTIILGEGVNGIAGTLYSVISAPGLDGPIVYNVGCAALIITFIAYLYFQSPIDQDDPQGDRRRGYWTFFHLPLLISLVLLLVGVKKQFLLSCFLSTAKKMIQVVKEATTNEQVRSNYANLRSDTMVKNYLLRRGIIWENEYDQLMARLTKNYTSNITWSDEQKHELSAWEFRISLKILINTYENFIGDSGSIANKTRLDIDKYYNNLTQSLGDSNSTDPAVMQYYHILTDLLNPSIQGARYIAPLAGVILVVMGILNLIHSGPSIRTKPYRWGAVFSRIIMGMLLILLLILNAGNIQSLWVSSRQNGGQAGVFRWVLAYWVLPTIALALGVQVTVETVLAICNGPSSDAKNANVKRPESQGTDPTIQSTVMDTRM